MTSAVRAGLIGAGVGAASMFLLDPERGARRRAVVRDKAVWAGRKTRDAAEWSPAACAACTGLTIGAVALAAMRAWGNGHSAADGRDPRSLPVEEGSAAFMTEAGILSSAPSQPDYGANTFFS